MTPAEALNVIEQAVNLANLKGVYSLPDVDKVLLALNTFRNLEEVKASIPELTAVSE
jgi:hypothetical protein